MASRLEQLLDSIAPYRTLDGVGRKIDDVLNTLVLPAATINSATELRALLVEAWRHVHGRVWGLHGALPEIDSSHEWAWCQRVLNAVYGGQEGWRSALELARTGVDGGLYGVVKAFLQKAAEQYLGKIIEAGIDSLWRQLSFEEQVAVTREYMSEYGSLLPASVADRSSVDLVLGFPRLLREHPRILQRASRIGRS